MSTTSHYLGHCQICQKKFKLTKGREGKIGHHGYKLRDQNQDPLIGHCRGSLELPYERSCDICKVALSEVEGQIDTHRETLQKIATGEVDTLEFTDYRNEIITVKKDECHNDWQWECSRDRKMREIRYSLIQMEAKVKRMTKLIDNWTLTDTKTIEEVATEKVAKKAELAIKKEAKEKRKAALLARREAEKTALFSKVRELAAQDKADPKAIEKLGRAIKKTSWRWLQDLSPIKAELIKLGIMNAKGWI